MNEFKKYMTVQSDSLTIYTKYPPKKVKSKITDKQAINLKKKYTSKGLTKSAAKKIKRILTHWILAINMSQADNKKKFARKRRYMVMVTLTLPAKQVETDNEMKRKYLNNFIIQLKQNYSEIHYLWVSEKQNNGNIHFHLMVDRWLDKVEIRRVWNKVLSNGNYIKEFEKKFNHRNPPSTKMTGQKKMKNPANYLTKYVTKSESSEKIEGHKWSCSEELLRICSSQMLVKDWYREYLYYYKKELKCRYYANDFVEVFYFDGNFLQDFLYHDLFLDNESDYRRILGKLFPEIEYKIACELRDRINEVCPPRQLELDI